jgi:Co/Zn/Cd efflux system component
LINKIENKNFTVVPASTNNINNNSLINNNNNNNNSNSNNNKKKYQIDNNFRAALIHVLADAIVSVFVIVALVIVGNVKNTMFLDPLVAVIGFLVFLFIY